MALGALIIKERLNCSDEELVEQVRENPYLQFFLGLEAFQQGSPFEASMMVHFRKRITAEMLCEINETLVAELRNSQATVDDTEPPVLGNLSDAQTDRPEPVKNQGKLLLDATCAPADITYPTDPKLLNESRKKSETLIDVLHQQRPAGNQGPIERRLIVTGSVFQSFAGPLIQKFVPSSANCLVISHATSNT